MILGSSLIETQAKRQPVINRHLPLCSLPAIRVMSSSFIEQSQPHLLPIMHSAPSLSSCTRSVTPSCYDSIHSPRRNHTNIVRSPSILVILFSVILLLLTACILPTQSKPTPHNNNWAVIVSERDRH